MSARAWRARRHKPPVYVKPLTWWDETDWDRAFIFGPEIVRRVDVARRRRLATLARRRARRQPPPPLLARSPWSYPDVKVIDEFAAAIREFTRTLDLNKAEVRKLAAAFYPLGRIVETPPL